jgi:arylsulfatase
MPVPLQRRPAAAGRHDLQYFEMFGNRGIYHRGWSAVTKHRTPWVMVGDLPPFDDDVWELYDGAATTARPATSPPTTARSLAKLQRLWLIEATKYNVLPMDDRGAERLEPALAGSADPDPGHLADVLPRHGPPVGEQRGQHQEQVVLGHRRRLSSPTAARRGVIIAQGGRFGGWALYAKAGRAKFVYNVLGIHEFATESGTTDPGRHAPGADGVRRTTAADSPRAATSPCTTTARGRCRPVGATQPMIFSADETTDIGYESGTTVTPTTPRQPAGSPARSTGCRSTSARMITTTSSTPTNASASPWRGSSAERPAASKTRPDGLRLSLKAALPSQA